jgi:thiol:disulfide interchange protein DsbA
MKRRAFLLGTSALLMQGRGVVAPAAAPTASVLSKAEGPYSEVAPVGEDARRCIAFFQFNCPHCRDLHPLLGRWGRSLPKDVGFEFMPVVTSDRGQIMAARAWYAAVLAAPSRLDAFAERAYGLVQDGRMSLEAGATWEAAYRQAGVSDFMRAWQRVPVDRIGRAVVKLAAYRVQSTPSLAVAGRYVVTLDDTQGDADLFLRLASGLLSKSIAPRSSTP